MLNRKHLTQGRKWFAKKGPLIPKLLVITAFKST